MAGSTQEASTQKAKKEVIFSLKDLMLLVVIPGSAGALYHGVMMITIPITARILLKEFISCIKWTSVAMCVAGSSLVVIGLFVSVDFSDAESVVVNATLVPDSTQHHQMTTTLDSFFFGIFICIASGLIEMVLVVVTKQMNDDVPNGVVLSLWNGIAGLVVSTVFMCCLELHKLTFPTDVENLLYLGGHTFCTAVACVTYFVALDYGSAIFCSIALNAEIPLRVLFEYVFATDIQPIDGNVLDVLGSVVVTLGVLLPAVIDLVKLKKVAAKDEEKTPILPG